MIVKDSLRFIITRYDQRFILILKHVYPSYLKWEESNINIVSLMVRKSIFNQLRIFFKNSNFNLPKFNVIIAFNTYHFILIEI